MGRSTGVLVLLVFFAAGAAMAAGWESIGQIAEGRKIKVVTDGGKSTRAVFVSASETMLVVRSKSGEQSIARADIRRVQVADPSRRVRKGLLSTAVGFSAGLAVGFAICPGCANEGARWKYMGPTTAVLTGAGIAGGFLPTPYRTVYETK